MKKWTNASDPDQIGLKITSLADPEEFILITMKEKTSKKEQKDQASTAFKKSTSTSTTKLEYLQSQVETVAKINRNGECEIVPTKTLSRGDEVWVLSPDNSFILTKIFWVTGD